METKELVIRAIARVRQNITEHVFLEIQRNTDLFRPYVEMVAEDGLSKYGEINREIGLKVKEITGGAPLERDEARISDLVQTFTRFAPETVHL